jgi:hypothetical protein
MSRLKSAFSGAFGWYGYGLMKFGLSLLKRPRQACCATPVQNQKSWKTAAFAQFQFFDPTGLLGDDAISITLGYDFLSHFLLKQALPPRRDQGQSAPAFCLEELETAQHQCGLSLASISATLLFRYRSWASLLLLNAIWAARNWSLSEILYQRLATYSLAACDEFSRLMILPPRQTFHRV